jgi:hypothetical protein
MRTLVVAPGVLALLASFGAAAGQRTAPERPFRKASPPAHTFDATPTLAGKAWKQLPTSWARPAQAVPAAPTPIGRIGALAREADEAESNGTVLRFLEQRKTELAAVESDLAAHLATTPDGTRAILMAVRLGFLRESMTVARLDTSSPGVDVSGPDAGFAALAVVVDQVLVQEPANADAHFWKARLSGVKIPALRNGKFGKVPRDLPQAVTSARRAVELAPANAVYRGVLATLLVEDGKPGEALDAVRGMVDAAGAPAAVTSLLSAWQALPVPDGATDQPLMAAGFSDIQVSQGKITSYPNMRIRMYTVPVRAADVEAFYKTHWKNFTLFDKGRERNGAVRIAMFGQFLTWKDGRLEPVTRERQLDAAADSAAVDGVTMVVTELLNLPPENRDRFAGRTGDTFCQITFMNGVAMNAR